MKTLALSFIFSILSIPAFANDGGMAYVDVKGIDPSNLSDGKISFYGKDAQKLRSILPAISSVDKDSVKHHNALAIVSDAYNLTISCSDAEQNINTGKWNAHAEGVRCEINLDKNPSAELKYDVLGDAFKFDKELVCKK